MAEKEKKFRENHVYEKFSYLSSKVKPSFTGHPSVRCSPRGRFWVMSLWLYAHPVRANWQDAHFVDDVFSRSLFDFFQFDGSHTDTHAYTCLCMNEQPPVLVRLHSSRNKDTIKVVHKDEKDASK